MLNVDSLNEGVVIDHIQAGSCMDLYKYLNLDELDCSIAIIKNAKSAHYGKKDIIKIEGNLNLNFDILGFIDPNISINYIREGEIVEKKKMTLPKEVRSIIRCKNPRCITSVEGDIEQIFKLSDEASHTYRCVYCEQEFRRK